MYESGTGVPQDAVQAYAWYNVVAAQGHKIAEEIREGIAESMSSDEIAAAQKLFGEYWQAYVVPFRD